MILIDTNVVSELMRPNPAQAVLDWFGRQDATVLHLSAVGEAELRYGVEIMPIGKKRDDLTNAIEVVVSEDFAGRVMPFDSAAAVAYAGIVANRRSAGRPISPFDGQIVATARVNDAALATRNVAHFEGCGIEVINPWNEEGVA